MTALVFGFTNLKLQEVFAMADARNQPSIQVLKKVGLKHIETFKLEEIPHCWLKVTSH